MRPKKKFVHPSAVIEPGARVGAGAKIWHFCHVRKGSVLNANVSLGKDVYIDTGVHVGEGSRIQNGVSVYNGVHIGRWCFVGPHVTFTNDRQPRAGNINWRVEETFMEEGASVGAGSTVVCGHRIGSYAIVGAGSLVTGDIPPFHLAVGLPARPTKMVCACGMSLAPIGSSAGVLLRACCKKNLIPEHYKSAREIVRRIASRFGP